MPWNYMQSEVVPQDSLIRPMIGPGSLPRQQALAEIQSILDRAAGVNRGMKPIADKWRRGAEDDTVYAGPFTWTVYEHPDGEDPRRAAMTWLEDYAKTIRRAGVNVQIAKLPD